MVCDVCDVCVVCLGEKVHNSQPTGVLGRKTYGRVAVDEENPCHMSLESPTRENKAKTQMSAKSKKHNLNTAATTTPRYTVVIFTR